MDNYPLRSRRVNGRYPARFYLRLRSFEQLPGDFRQSFASGLSASDPHSLLRIGLLTLPDQRIIVFSFCLRAAYEVSAEPPMGLEPITYRLRSDRSAN